MPLLSGPASDVPPPRLPARQPISQDDWVMKIWTFLSTALDIRPTDNCEYNETRNSGILVD